MSVETVAEALEREHHEIDEGIAEYVAGLGSGTPDPAPLKRATAALRRHIYLEEEYLFPPLRAAGLTMPVFVMVREHGEMWKTMDALDEDLDAGTAGQAVADRLREFQGQLDSHNPKEEEILYPQAGTALSASADAELRELLESGHTPDGWVCEGLR